MRLPDSAPTRTTNVYPNRRRLDWPFGGAFFGRRGTHAERGTHASGGKRGQGQRPGLRDERRPGDREASGDPRRPGLLLLQRRLPREIRRRSEPISFAVASEAARAAARDDLHLPDASGNPPAGPRLVSDLRHGAGAGTGDRGCGAERGTARYDAPVLDRLRARAAGLRPRNGGPRPELARRPERPD